MKKTPATKCKYIVVTGGVLSGLGKGIAAASIGNLLSGRLKVVPVKCDGYLNTDPGTMNPIEHGEVFVLDDGGEVDMDFGHYERFMDVNAKFHWNLTMGKVFKSILEKERRGDYLGKTVQFLPHVTDRIKEWFREIAEEEKADVMLIEVGGTVGDLENQFYLEAVRQLKRDVGPGNVIYIHLTYVPVPEGVNEQKSKPTQMSVRLLNEKGIEPDVVIGRCKEFLAPAIKEKISSYCNIPPSHVISGPDVKSVYEIPLIYEREGLPAILHSQLGIYSPPDLRQWEVWVNNIKRNREKPTRIVTIALCGKYTALEDSYASVVEALTHAGAHHDVRVEMKWVDTTRVDSVEDAREALEGVQGVIVPGGFGKRGIEGKMHVIRYCRENDLPYLGICYGMQLAVVEFARNVCGLQNANTSEVRDEGVQVDHPVIDILPGQKNLSDKGGTMRLGGQTVEIRPGTRASVIYGRKTIRERFRHRYEVNPAYVPQIEAKGLVFSGKHPTENIMQVMELPGHKFFMACQFHPELTSNLRRPEPLFYELVKAALEV
jgi:CTP synthase